MEKMLKLYDNIEVKVFDINHMGQGVGKYDAFVIFIDNTLIGETVLIEITAVKKNYAVGKLIKIIEKSENRRKPFCSEYDECGGCSLQHFKYEAQLKWKKNLVGNAVKRIGGINDFTLYDTIEMEAPYRYRNKAQFPVGERGAGFFAAGSHDIIPVEDCVINDEKANLIKDIFMKFINEQNISIYNESRDEGLVRHIAVRTGYNSKEIMAIVVVNGENLPYSEKLVKLLQNVEGFKTLVLNVNTENTNVIMGKKNKRIFGKGYIYDFIGGYKFKISPESFFQVNPRQIEILYGKVMEFAKGNSDSCGTVFDMYCGVGAISIFISSSADKVYGVESVHQAVKDANENKSANLVDNVEFIEGKAEDVVRRLYEGGAKADVVIVDPPRKGCGRVLLETVAAMSPERIVYVSCNPATLARDLRYLCGVDVEQRKERPEYSMYKVEKVQPVDLFPWSGHVETVVLLTRKKLHSKYSHTE